MTTGAAAPKPVQRATPFRPRTEMLLDVVSQPRYLLATVRERYRNENRLVVAASYDFDLPALYQASQRFEIFRMRALQPLEQ